MKSKKKVKKRYIANLEKHIEAQRDSVRYSVDRFDILIDSLSTGCLIFSMGFADNIVQDIDTADTSNLKTSWLLFAICLIANLISQVTGYYANKLEIRISKNLIRIERGKDVVGNQKRLECWSGALDSTTTFLNAISLLSFIGGIIALVRFSGANL